MNVFVTQRCIRDKSGSDYDALDLLYLEFFRRSVLFPADACFLSIANNIQNLECVINKCPPDFIVLTGGNNVDPRDFGSSVAQVDLAPRRDEVERHLLEWAFSKGVPVLGICRGFQFINVFLGGSLSLRIQNHEPAKAHACVYEGRSYDINSYHDHGISPEDLSPKLAPMVMTADESLVEGFVANPCDGPPILGVQWHPERPGAHGALFRKLSARAFHRRSGR